MSDWIAMYTHRTSGESFKVHAMDDHFGRHEYGYKLPDGTILRESEFEAKYVRSDDQEPIEREFKAMREEKRVELIRYYTGTATAKLEDIAKSAQRLLNNPMQIEDLYNTLHSIVACAEDAIRNIKEAEDA